MTPSDVADYARIAADSLAKAITRLDNARLDTEHPDVQRFVATVDDLVQGAASAVQALRVGYTAETAQAAQLAEALRLTAEWSMAVALPGWSWFDALQSYHAHMGWDTIPATGRPCGVTESEDTEPLWSTEHIHQVLADPLVSDPDRNRALRHLAAHARADNAMADRWVEAEAAEACAVRDLPPLGDEAGAVRGVPFLLEQLSMLARESVYLWFNPERSLPWYVWTGSPVGSSGGEWGAGQTAADALGDAFRRITGAIFDGRLVR